MTSVMDRSKCPLCGQDNGCKVDHPAGCWCEEVVVPEGLLKRVPRDQQAIACICRRCIDRYHQTGSAISSLQRVQS